ncbi:response regulator [Flavobacterium hydatis]|uniref:histidine kinase n=1 Tax=Flavobacterium hydatis TaxID=991 RepID=A0A086ALI4_FLAHY|nr:response regulator [Flavobacterium hydatis]KFF17548.1 histidine kinase [Flavobacterium hydatis]OXA94646.1 hybrid sensor histidine kinase/response regulator [Flavobacterium hydatis]
MFKIRIVLSLFLLICFVKPVIAKTDLPTEQDITRTADKALKYLKESDFEKSLIVSRIVLQQALIAKNNNLIAVSYNIIAANYNEFSEFDKAIFYYKKALSFANKTTNNILKNRINNNLGNMYCFEKKQYEKGIEYYKKSLDYSKKENDTDLVYLINLNITWAYFDIGEFSLALPYFKYINEHHEDHPSESTIVAFNLLNGMYYSHIGDNDKASAYFIQAIKEGQAGTEKSDLLNSYLEYSKFLNKIGDYKQAYQNIIKHNSVKEILYNERKLKSAEKAGFNLELDEYKRQIGKIEIEKGVQYQDLRKSRIIVLLFVLTSCIFLILIVTLYKNVVFKKRTNAQLLFTNEELIKAKEQAEEASVLKTQFISTISHELRTPLYGVVGITNMLLEEHKELARSQHLSSLKFSARYLLSLVNDILQINKIEENKVVLESLTFNISDEINMIKNSLSFLSQKNNNYITVIIDSDIPEYLIGDKLRLAQILMNLVSNALKFTKRGEVFIIANLVKVAGKEHYIEFQVKDTGMGIAVPDQDKIFEKFVQVGRNEQDYQGTGLGLTIVKRLLGLFGSSISLESNVGEGTTFTFTIAFEYDPEKTKSIINEIQVDLTSNQVFRVLVVEDNRINQLVTKKIIEKNNYSCTVVDDGFAALEILDTESFDVVLMDINMPMMNGFETTRKIRLKGIKTPIVALTAFDKDEITDEAISAGINDIIIKPFESVKLFKIINCLIVETENVGAMPTFESRLI